MEWIDIRERLPEEGVPVLLYGIIYTRGGNEYKYIREGVRENNNYQDGYCIEWIHGVSHWMPLPEPPLNKTAP